MRGWHQISQIKLKKTWQLKCLFDIYLTPGRKNQSILTKQCLPYSNCSFMKLKSKSSQNVETPMKISAHRLENTRMYVRFINLSHAMALETTTKWQITWVSLAQGLLLKALEDDLVQGLLGNQIMHLGHRSMSLPPTIFLNPFERSSESFHEVSLCFLLQQKNDPPISPFNLFDHRSFTPS